MHHLKTCIIYIKTFCSEYRASKNQVNVQSTSTLTSILAYFSFIGTNDTFDCRRRVWYTEATASSKDMVIALDMSGSMTGLNKIGISKIIMHSILQTFYQNDFFNIIYFNETISYAIPCAKSLIQATPLNKKFNDGCHY